MLAWVQVKSALLLHSKILSMGINLLKVPSAHVFSYACPVLAKQLHAILEFKLFMIRPSGVGQSLCSVAFFIFVCDVSKAVLHLRFVPRPNKVSEFRCISSKQLDTLAQFWVFLLRPVNLDATLLGCLLAISFLLRTYTEYFGSYREFWLCYLFTPFFDWCFAIW